MTSKLDVQKAREDILKQLLKVYEETSGHGRVTWDWQTQPTAEQIALEQLADEGLINNKHSTLTASGWQYASDYFGTVVKCDWKGSECHAEATKDGQVVAAISVAVKRPKVEYVAVEEATTLLARHFAVHAASVGPAQPEPSGSGPEATFLNRPPPVVFISYSHDTPEHETRVLNLAQTLRSEWGLDVWIDKFEPNPPEGWTRWMRRKIDEAEFVLCIFTETYKRRFEGDEQPGRGLGATWEGFLTESNIYQNGAVNQKYVPAVLDGGDSKNIGRILVPFTRYSLPSETESFYRHVTRQPEHVPAPLPRLPHLAPRPVVAPEPSGSRFEDDVRRKMANQERDQAQEDAQRKQRAEALLERLPAVHPGVNKSLFDEMTTRFSQGLPLECPPTFFLTDSIFGGSTGKDITEAIQALGFVIRSTTREARVFPTEEHARAFEHHEQMADFASRSRRSG